MGRRKMVAIRELLEIVNRRNAESTCDPLRRSGWNSVLEEVLMDANVYAGYTYLQSMHVPAGERPGVVHGLDGPEHCDESRRNYIVHSALLGRRTRKAAGAC
jgi:hypothetical protein